MRLSAFLLKPINSNMWWDGHVWTWCALNGYIHISNDIHYFQCCFDWCTAKAIVKPVSSTHVSRIANAAEVMLKLPFVHTLSQISCARATYASYEIMINA